MPKVSNTKNATSIILSLVDGAGRKLPEYQVHGRSIVVVTPDQPFRVKVALLGRPKQQKNRPFTAEVHVDGANIDYKPGQNLSNQMSLFPYGSFLEATTGVATAEVDGNAVEESPVGTVKVDVYDMRYSHSEKRRGPHGSRSDDEDEANEADPHVDDGTEFEEQQQQQHEEEEAEDVAEEENLAEEEGLSAYERERLRTIRENKKVLRQLGLDKPIAAAAAGSGLGSGSATHPPTNVPPPKLKRTLLYGEEVDEREKKRLCARLVEPDTKKAAVAVPLGGGEARTAYKPQAKDKAESVAIWYRTDLIASLQLEYTDEAGLHKAGYIPPDLVGSSSEPICLEE